MNAVEIEEAISALADERFDASEFPFAFLQAFGNKEVTLKRLRKGDSNKSDLGGVLQTNNIHIAVASAGIGFTKRIDAVDQVNVQLAHIHCKLPNAINECRVGRLFAVDGARIAGRNLLRLLHDIECSNRMLAHSFLIV